jgi:hypothetical protein
MFLVVMVIIKDNFNTQLLNLVLFKVRLVMFIVQIAGTFSAQYF